MNHELDEQELICFVENATELDPDAHKRIMEQVAANPDLRERVARIRKELYIVDSQIPEYDISREFHEELKSLAELWLRSKLKQKLRMRRVLFGKEFPLFASALIILLLVALAVIYLRL